MEPIHTQSTYLRNTAIDSQPRVNSRDLRRDHCVGLASVGSEKHRDRLHLELALARTIGSAHLTSMTIASPHRRNNQGEIAAMPLRNRGSLTICFTPEAIAGWKAQPQTTPGERRHYSDLAIETALTLRTVFRLALRQSENLIDPS